MHSKVNIENIFNTKYGQYPKCPPKKYRQTDLILNNGPFWPRKIGHRFPCISSFLRFWGYQMHSKVNIENISNTKYGQYPKCHPKNYRQKDLILNNGPFWPKKIGHRFPCISSF
jgi:hypothetical protein